MQGAFGQVDGGFVHLPPGVVAPDGSSWMPAARKMFKTFYGDAVIFRMEVAALQAAQGCEGIVQLLAHSEAASSSGSDCEHEEEPLQLLLSLVEGEGLDVALVRGAGELTGRGRTRRDAFLRCCCANGAQLSAGPHVRVRRASFS